MSKILIGLLFIITGLAYASMAIDTVYSHTLGWLVQYQWIKPPPEDKNPENLKNLLGRKSTIILYSLILIFIGIYLLVSRQN